jgi:hypothetical protein
MKISLTMAIFLTVSGIALEEFVDRWIKSKQAGSR